MDNIRSKNINSKFFRVKSAWVFDVKYYHNFSENINVLKMFKSDFWRFFANFSKILFWNIYFDILENPKLFLKDTEILHKCFKNVPSQFLKTFIDIIYLRKVPPTLSRQPKQQLFLECFSMFIRCYYSDFLKSIHYIEWN